MLYSMFSVMKTSLLRIITKFLDGLTLQKNSHFFVSIGPPPATQHTMFICVIIFFLYTKYHVFISYGSSARYRVAAILHFDMSLIRNIVYLNTSSIVYIPNNYKHIQI